MRGTFLFEAAVWSCAAAGYGGLSFRDYLKGMSPLPPNGSAMRESNSTKIKK